MYNNFTLIQGDGSKATIQVSDTFNRQHIIARITLYAPALARLRSGRQLNRLSTKQLLARLARAYRLWQASVASYVSRLSKVYAVA